MKTITATQTRKDFYNIISGVDKYNEPIHIINTKDNSNVILISQQEYEEWLETFYLMENGMDKIVLERLKNDFND